jgi:hypothetical protein
MAFAGDIGSRLKDNLSCFNEPVGKLLHHERHSVEWKPIVLFGEYKPTIVSDKGEVHRL